MTQRDRKQKKVSRGTKKKRRKKSMVDIQHAQKYIRERGVRRGGGSNPPPDPEVPC